MNLKPLKLVIGSFVAVFFCILVSSQVESGVVVGAIKEVNLILLVSSMIVFLIGYILRVYRWWLMLSQFNTELDIKKVIGPFFTSAALNNVLPFRAGDIYRVMFLGDQLGINRTYSLTILLLERLLDLFVILIFLMVVSYCFNLINFYFFGFNYLWLIIFLLFFWILLSTEVFTKLRKLFGKHKFYKIVEERLVNFKGINFSRAVILNLLLISFLSWLIEGFAFLLVAHSFLDIKFPYASLYALPLATLSTVLPGTPGFVGTFDYFAALAMNTMGNDMSISVAYAIIIHATIWLPVTVIGLFYFYNIQSLYRKVIND